MADARQSLIVRVFDTYTEASRKMHADLSARWTSLRFSTALHGGFKDCVISVPMRFEDAWQALRRENLRGWHFYHLEITQDQRTVWEGRIMKVGIGWSGSQTTLQLTALGYWSSLRDQYYDAADSSNTDWTSGSGHTSDDIIKEMLADEGPDISTTVTGITATSRDLAGIVLTDRDYPQNIILSKIAPLADSDGKQYFFAVWENRTPYWTAKAVSNPVEWFVWLRNTSSGQLIQDAQHLRNNILPVKGGTEGTEANDTSSQALYPKRELKVTVPTGVSSNAENDMRDAILTERADPVQTQSFTVSGTLYSTRATQNVAGALVEMPKWWVRAGETVRIQDLVPASDATPALDSLRTFWIRSTTYTAESDTLVIQPDSPQETLGSIISRLGQVERDR